MNTNKLMLKAVVLTQLMQSLQSQGKEPDAEMKAVIQEFDAEITAAEASGNNALDSNIEDVYAKLLEALEGLEEEL